MSGQRELFDAFLEAYPSAPGGTQPPNIFDDFLLATGGVPLHTKTSFPLLSLLPQVVPAHRVWCDATDSAERFIGVEALPLLFRKTSKDLWARIHILQDDLDRASKTHKHLLTETRLNHLVREVADGSTVPPARYVVRLEQIVPVKYSGTPADNLAELVAKLRPFIWSTATTIRPFRKYYLYACPPAEHPHLLPQTLSLYAITYYLGSITRYRPQHFSNILAGAFGEFIQEFLSSQPSQFLYLMASDFAKRDVARAPLV